MKRKLTEVIATLQKHYDQNADIYIVWFAKEELDEQLNRTATTDEWQKFVDRLDERDYIEEVLNQEIVEVLTELDIKNAKDER